MYKNNKISVIIPCYNEEKGISAILKKTPAFIDETIVVDNGSSDKTVSIARKFKPRIIHERQRGYGFVLKTGIKNASGDIIVTLDGDATYPIEDAQKIIDYLLENNLDFVSGCRLRLAKKSSMSFINIVGIKILNIFALLLFQKKFQDILSGMWVFKANTYKKLLLVSNDWNLSEEIKIEAAKKCKFSEYHINHYKRMGDSKLLKWKVGFKNLIFLFWKRYYSNPPLSKILQIVKK